MGCKKRIDFFKYEVQTLILWCPWNGILQILWYIRSQALCVEAHENSNSTRFLCILEAVEAKLWSYFSIFSALSPFLQNIYYAQTWILLAFWILCTDLSPFACSNVFKLVILDECDAMTKDAQFALRRGQLSITNILSPNHDQAGGA